MSSNKEKTNNIGQEHHKDEKHHPGHLEGLHDTKEHQLHHAKEHQLHHPEGHQEHHPEAHTHEVGAQPTNLEKTKQSNIHHQMDMREAKVFENPMKEYFIMADHLSKIFSLLMGLKFKLFDTIEELGDKADTKSILTKINFKTSTRHMLDLLDQLYVEGFLMRQGTMEQALYKNTEYTKKYLLRKSSDNYDDVYMNLFRYIKKFENLENDFSSGLTRMFTDEISLSEEDLHAYMSYYYKVNTFNFDFIVNNFDFNKFKKVIDLHGLCGTLSLKIKNKFKNCEVVSFENSKLKSMINNFTKKESIPEGSICFEYGDLIKDKIPECDCVIMPHILMHFSKENREKILKMVYDCLKPGGMIIIMENLVDPERSKDSHGLKISFMLGLLGYEGYVMMFDEYKEMISQIGFKNIDRISKGQGVSDFITATK
jgi:SAM-dependent methyltransferase